MNQPKPNDRVSEYILTELIGSGAFGQVFRARHHVWPDQIVAVKIPTDPELVRVLRREGVAMHQVVHPNVVKPIGFDPFADPPYLIMEYVDGGDLRQLLGQGPLPIDRAVTILTHVLSGLAAAHAAGVAHLDIKPSNILLTRDGTAKLSDFGLGRALLKPDESVMQSLSLAAEAKSITGTLEYMSPEQRRGQPLDQRADIYSVGVVLFEMLTGERPAGGEKPSDLRAEVPPWLDQLFARSYARLEWRYPSAEAMLSDLEAGQSLPASPVAGAAASPFVLDSPVAVAQLIAPPVTTPSTSGAACPRCGLTILDDDQFCVHCGRQVAPTVRRCARCGGYPQRFDKYCVLCGATL